MLGRTHRAFALASAAGICLAAASLRPESVASITWAGRTGLFLGGAWAAASLPDIDRVLFWHRGFTHTIWVVAGLLFAAHAIPDIYILWGQPLLYGIALGYFSHLLGDAFSKAGVAWFYPLQGYVREPGGVFYVKGFRGPFLPLYEVGDKAFAFAPALWYGLAVICLGLLAKTMLG